MISRRGFWSTGVLLALVTLRLSAAPTVQVAGLQGYVEPPPALPAVFGNREQGIDVDLAHAAPQSGPLLADLFQVSGELTMPLAANIHLEDAATVTGAPSQRLHITIKFPDVKQRGEILVRLSLGGATPTPLGDLRFEVFPASVTKELTSLLQPRPDGSVPVVLFGSGRKLHTFFGSIGVRFDDGGNHVPEQFEPSRVYLGESASATEIVPTQEMINTARVAVFAPDPSLPAGIYAERIASGAFVHVTLPFLDNLGVDPRAQLALIKVIHLLNLQSSSTTPSSL